MLASAFPTLSASVVAQQAGNDAGGGMVAMLIWLIVVGAILAGWWKVFTKAGEPGWAAIIPIYNIVVLLRIVGRPWWWLLLMFVPIVSLIVSIMIFLDLAKVFGKGTGFAIGLILLNPIFMLLLGFGEDQYRRPAMASA